MSRHCRQMRIVILLLAFCTSVASSQKTGAPAGIRTPIPPLLEKWKADVGGPNASDTEVIKAAEGHRPAVLKLRDPFSPLADMKCAERLAKGEKVVWEDGTAMALVDFGNLGSKLLVVPKQVANFPTDLKPSFKEQMDYLSRVAAATCDALVVASGQKPEASKVSCTIRISPPSGLDVRQLHVHVQATTGVSAPVDDTFLQRTGAHLRSLMGGTGCF
jgi:hypothetical protein